MSREYTAIPHEYLEEMDCLSDAEFGRLIRALLAYSMTGEEQTLSGGEKAHWKRVRNRENRYRESFDNQDKVKTDRAKTAASARWSNAKNAYAYSSIPSNAKNAKTKADTESKTDTEGYTSPDGDVCAEQNVLSAPPAITLPLNDGKEYAVSAGQIEEWGQLYPAVDVMQQLRNMKGWLAGNPQKRKTRRGILAFINRWLAKEQNRPSKRAETSRKGSNAGGPRELDEEEIEAIRRMMEEDDDVGKP